MLSRPYGERLITEGAKHVTLIRDLRAERLSQACCEFCDALPDRLRDLVQKRYAKQTTTGSK